MTGRALARLLGLLVLWSGVELLERVSYAAGVDDELERRRRQSGLAVAVVDLRDVDEDLEAADVSDVVTAHAECCGIPAC